MFMHVCICIFYFLFIGIEVNFLYLWLLHYFYYSHRLKIKFLAIFFLEHVKINKCSLFKLEVIVQIFILVLLLKKYLMKNYISSTRGKKENKKEAFELNC
jgi:hypothetical protein